MKKELKMVKELVKEGNLQEALEMLTDVIYNMDADDIELNDVFDGKYITGESAYQIEENLDESKIEVENDGTYYEYNRNEDESLIVKNVTKKSVLNTIKEVEKFLKVA